MLLVLDKEVTMKSPKDMKIIQIDITNACVNRCSNCTRFCGHHTKPFFMDFETFKKAVDSFEGWEGCVGIIGGEPTLHPEIEKFIDYLREKRIGAPLKLSREPIFDMQEHIYKKLNNTCSKIGFWSSLNKGYYRHFETINDSFDWQLLNDHNNKCLHQAILMARKDLGISDEEFKKRRDNCFAQNTWSATITPKGAFFCEIAAALDMLFNGPGGWAIEKGWYNRTPDEFTEQLQWCELCSLCLDVPQRISCEDIDDITPTLLKKLQKINSPKIKAGKYCLHDINDYKKHKQVYKSFEHCDDYMQAGSNIRTTTDNRNYYPRDFVIVNLENASSFINKKTDWVILSKNNKDAKKIKNYLKKMVINPGCLYRYKGEYIFNPLARSIRDKIKSPQNFDLKKLTTYYVSDKIIDIKIKKTDYLSQIFGKKFVKIIKIFKYIWF